MGYRISDHEYLSSSAGKAHYFKVEGRDAKGDNVSKTQEDFNRWSEYTIDVGEFKVIPFGSNNDIPNEIQEVIFPNHLAPRILARKTQLLFGQGPYMYATEADGKEFVRMPKTDAAIKAWLDSFDHEDLLVHNSTEYFYGEFIYTKIRNRVGSRTRRPVLPLLEKLSSVKCRLAYHRLDDRKKPTHVLVGDWKNGNKDFEVYPIWDRNDPDKHPFAVHVTGFGSFGLENYVLPRIYGVLNWIKRSTAAPKIIEAFTNNSLNIRFHITSPQKFWDDQRKIIQDKCKEKGIKFQEKMMEDLEDKIFDTLSEVLSGVDNVGKFWHNKTVTKLIGNSAVEEGWKITPIKQEVKEYVEAQILVANKSDFANQAGLGLHAALAFVGADGKSDSGSEQLYAYLIHQLTSIPLEEMFVCKAINDILLAKINSNIKVGFYQVAAQRQEDTTSSQRVNNS